MSETDRTESFEQARAGLPDVSPDLSVIWKPLRRLFEDGSPIDPATVLFYDVGGGRRLPFAALATTRGDRLLLWPPWDALEPGEYANGRTFAIHHATLELPNGETHFTRFDSDGQRVHDDRKWRLASFGDGVKLWLILAFRVALLEKQAGGLEQNVKMPTTDARRREDEFRRYAATMTRVAVNTPELRGDCLVTVIHLLEDVTDLQGTVNPAHFPTGRFWEDWIDGWPDGDSFQIAPTRINVGGVNLLLLTVSPLGRLKGACFVGSVDPHPATG